MTKTMKWLCFGMVILLVIANVRLFITNKSQLVEEKTKIDSLQQIIDSIKFKQDTILVEIRIRDTIIKNAKEQFKKDSVVIVNQSVNDDVEFFSNYLSTHNQ